MMTVVQLLTIRPAGQHTDYSARFGTAPFQPSSFMSVMSNGILITGATSTINILV